LIFLSILVFFIYFDFFNFFISFSSPKNLYSSAALSLP